jgi:uncharacterized protein (TIGR02117 family)
MAKSRSRPGLIWSALAVLTLLALVFLPSRHPDPALYPARDGEPRVTIYVVNNGFHTDLVAPAEALAATAGPAAEAAATLKPAPWVSFGWGDAKFYTQSGFTAARAADAFRALFGWKNPSVVMMEPLRASPDRLYRDGVMRLQLSRDGFARLVRRLDASYDSVGGHPEPKAVSGWGDARFFGSRERFSFLHLCNHWAGELLNAGGIATRPVLDTLAQGLTLDVERAAKLDRTSGGS